MVPSHITPSAGAGTKSSTKTTDKHASQWSQKLEKSLCFCEHCKFQAVEGLLAPFQGSSWEGAGKVLVEVDEDKRLALSAFAKSALRKSSGNVSMALKRLGLRVMPTQVSVWESLRWEDKILDARDGYVYVYGDEIGTMINTSPNRRSANTSRQFSTLAHILAQ